MGQIRFADKKARGKRIKRDLLLIVRADIPQDLGYEGRLLLLLRLRFLPLQRQVPRQG